ncbi:MAG: hypothetical protein F2829_04620, partial [Actinobacteria bacterium]|nr:hypothetical protein [Actinomycetota bacterium]
MSSDKGLSIFDEPESADDAAEETQVLPVTAKDEPEVAKPQTGSRATTQAAPAAPSPDAEATRRSPVVPPAARPPASRPAAGPAATTTSPVAPTPAGAAPLPVVRRGGYDKAAVDQRVGQLQNEKSGLATSLASSEQRVIELEAELSAAREELQENANPTYAGLGGRASSMLKMAEEEAADVRRAGHRDAADIRKAAERDATSIRADAAREADDMRMVQLKELDEMRARLTADA